MTFQIRLDVWLTFVTTLDIFWGDGFDFLFGGGGREEEIYLSIIHHHLPLPLTRVLETVPDHFLSNAM